MTLASSNPIPIPISPPSSPEKRLFLQQLLLVAEQRDPLRPVVRQHDVRPSLE